MSASTRAPRLRQRPGAWTVVGGLAVAAALGWAAAAVATMLLFTQWFGGSAPRESPAAVEFALEPPPGYEIYSPGVFGSPPKRASAAWSCASRERHVWSPSISGPAPAAWTLYHFRP